MQIIFNVLPTRWRQKLAGIDKKGNHVTVSLRIARSTMIDSDSLVTSHTRSRRRIEIRGKHILQLADSDPLELEDRKTSDSPEMSCEKFRFS